MRLRIGDDSRTTPQREPGNILHNAYRIFKHPTVLPERIDPPTRISVYFPENTASPISVCVGFDSHTFLGTTIYSHVFVKREIIFFASLYFHFNY